MIKYSKENNAGIIVMNRPEKSNALHPEMVKQFVEKLILAEKDEQVRVLIIRGEGKSFCAGADLNYLNELKDYNISENYSDSENLANFFLQIYNFPKPTIAAVNGAAIAGGCGVASACDFVIADRANAKFGYSEIKIGFVPAIVSTFLIKKIGEGKTKQLLLSGEIINAAAAKEIGLVNYLSDDALSEALVLSQKLMLNSDLAMWTTKKIINNISRLNADEAVKYCINLNTILRTSEDFREGLQKFLNKK